MNVETWSYWFRRWQALRLTWTHEEPTVPGWYWRRYEIAGTPFVDVVEVVKSGSHLVLSDYGGLVEYARGEWAGPIPEPEG
jgi:hypothetical protein